MLLKKSGSVVFGAQFGDEGKGKIVDYLAGKVDIVVRFHGGNNAGHTVVNELGTFKMHLVPSGVFSPKVQIIIGNGVVVDPAVLLGELSELENAHIVVNDRLFVSPRAHVIMPYHRVLDNLYEKHKGENKTGTTGRGIGPAYADKVSYMGIRVEDILSATVLSDKLEALLPIKNKIIVALGGTPLVYEDILKDYVSFGKKLREYVKDPIVLLREAARRGRKVLYEGAQGFFLDNDWGTYPFVTASSVLPGSIQAGAGGDVRTLGKITGVAKAYLTRVGEGPMPTELTDKAGEDLRRLGNEFGATTGRPRRCGWFDIEMVRFSCEMTGATELALTKIDVLSSFATIFVCTGYKVKGKKYSYHELNTLMLGQVEPVYKSFPGWKVPILGISSFTKLPPACRRYILFLEQECGLPIRMISTGPQRKALILRNS